MHVDFCPLIEVDMDSYLSKNKQKFVWVPAENCKLANTFYIILVVCSSITWCLCFDTALTFTSPGSDRLDFFSRAQ